MEANNSGTKASYIAGKYGFDEQEFEAFVLNNDAIKTSGTTEVYVDNAYIDYAVKLYKSKKASVTLSADASIELLQKNLALLEEIARYTKKGSFWIRFWSILSFIAAGIFLFVSVIISAAT